MICHNCGESFEARRADARFCSAKCRQAATRAKRLSKAWKPHPNATKTSPRVDPPDAKWYYFDPKSERWKLIGDGSTCTWQKVPKHCKLVDHISPSESKARNARGGAASADDDAPRWHAFKGNRFIDLGDPPKPSDDPLMSPASFIKPSTGRRLNAQIKKTGKLERSPDPGS